MNEITLYKKCIELSRTVNVQELVDETFLTTLKNKLPEILAEPEESLTIPRQILHTAFTALSKQYKTTIDETAIVTI